jgi:hypothetical protein
MIAAVVEVVVAANLTIVVGVGEDEVVLGPIEAVVAVVLAKIGIDGKTGGVIAIVKGVSMTTSGEEAEAEVALQDLDQDLTAEGHLHHHHPDLQEVTVSHR